MKEAKEVVSPSKTDRNSRIPINLLPFYKMLGNSTVPDQTAPEKQSDTTLMRLSDLGLHCPKAF